MDSNAPLLPPVFRSERFDLRKLHYFVRIVELGSISKAATDLNTAQPALSKSIRNLEFDLRTTLLERSAKGVQPTLAGQKLYEHCKDVFQRLECARAEIQGTEDVPMGSISIGMPYSVNLILAAPLLRETLTQYPKIQLQIVEEHSFALAGHLLSGRIDMAILVSDGDLNSALQAEEILEEDFLLVRQRRAVVGEVPNEGVQMKDVVDLPLILPKGQASTMVEERFARRSLRLRTVREIETFSMIPQCVEAGIGNAIMSAGWISALKQTQTVSSSFREGIMNRRLALCYAASRRLSSAALCVKTLVKKTAADLVESRQWQAARILK